MLEQLFLPASLSKFCLLASCANVEICQTETSQKKPLKLKSTLRQKGLHCKQEGFPLF